MNVAVIGDGSTDRLIFLKIAQVLLSDEIQRIELKRQNCRDSIDRFWNEASKLNCYWFPEKPAETLRDSIANILIGAFADLSNEIGQISNNDLIIISTDAERYFNANINYFCHWSFSLSKIMQAGIEIFYQIKLNQGYEPKQIPIVLPISLFPSTDIIIAVAKNINPFYGKKPKELKDIIYGTTDLRFLHDDEFEEKALNVLTVDSIKRIFRKIPETRTLLQLLCAVKTC